MKKSEDSALFKKISRDKISAISALFHEKNMTGWELKLWRRGMCWSREKAAREMGVSLRTWHDWENAQEVSRQTELATLALSTRQLLPEWRTRPRRHPREAMLSMLENMHGTRGK